MLGYLLHLFILRRVVLESVHFLCVTCTVNQMSNTFAGIKGSAGQLPGAVLLCLSFTPKDVNSQCLSRVRNHMLSSFLENLLWYLNLCYFLSQVSVDFHAGYESALVEIAASLQLSRNIFTALLSLQSWKSFMRRWIRANISSLDAKAPSVSLDKTSKAATDILKVHLFLF